MIQFEMWGGGTYRYTLGADEDPSEALAAEQRNGGRRLSITMIEDGKRMPDYMLPFEAPARNTEEDEEEEENFQDYA